MEKRYKCFVTNVVFLICAYVDIMKCSPLKFTDPYVCPRKATMSHPMNQTQWIIECCPNFVNKNGNCQACPAGYFGKDCWQPCLPNYYGVQCKQTCNCTIMCPSGTHGVNCTDECFCAHDADCNPITGDCLCPAGRVGPHCTKECPSGKYGVDCRNECLCAHNAECDPVTGDCLCSIGWFGDHCTSACPSGRYGMNCKEECFCAHDANCDPVTGGCICPTGRFGCHCTKVCPNGTFGNNCSGICACSAVEQCDVQTGKCIQCNLESDNGGCNFNKDCHQGYYDYNLNYSCSNTCICNDGALCNTISGICECKGNPSCINVRNKPIPNNTSTIYINRDVLILVVTVAVSLICVLLLALTYLLLGRYLTHRRNRSSQHIDNATDSIQGLYNESHYYSEIHDDQLDNIRSSRMIENDNPQNRFQQTTNGEHGYQNNAQLLSNIDMFEEQRPNSYCSLQHIHDDYLNPYCALRFERRVHSCMF
ncbi:unnamed protein product [Mytilus edulis]|uniref:EGF-like domain-containing protein n=1 Tax=Mytilus edulis TaxID=6550 RepID=A0A8S3STA4_MYTED|nr:unnamed protein product [Mytilus edulis]